MEKKKNEHKKAAMVKFLFVTKRYELVKNKQLKLNPIVKYKGKDKKKNETNFLALNNIEFEIAPGETIGLIGINGSGKSTVVNILSGIIPQTTGLVDVQGETSIISIGAGLKNELTGIENIRLKSLMMGKKMKEINKCMSDVIEFADIGDFINQPVKNYSSGMKSRLGFSIAIHSNPDVLIIDEALSVGDETFYQKCVEKIIEFKKRGKTIFYVSHSLSQVQLICDKVIWMHYGEIKEFGKTEEVILSYKKFINWFKGLTKQEKKEYKNKYITQQQRWFDKKKSYEDILNQSYKENHSRKQHRKIKNDFLTINKEDEYSYLEFIIVFISVAMLIFFGSLNLTSTSFAHFIGIANQPEYNIDEISEEIKIDTGYQYQETISEKDSSIESLEGSESEKEEIENESNSSLFIREYVIEEGDVLERIALLFNVSVDQLMEVNKLDSNVLEIGQVLKIPNNEEL